MRASCEVVDGEDLEQVVVSSNHGFGTDMNLRLRASMPDARYQPGRRTRFRPSFAVSPYYEQRLFRSPPTACWPGSECQHFWLSITPPASVNDCGATILANDSISRSRYSMLSFDLIASALRCPSFQHLLRALVQRVVHLALGCENL